MRGVGRAVRPESAAFDSSGNWRLASPDETPGRYQRKIFLLQKFRFGVRATPLRAAFRMLRHVDRATTSISRITKNTTVQRLFLFFRNRKQCLSPIFCTDTRVL